MGLARFLFRLASFLTTITILPSGNPKRFGRHVVRRQARKAMGRWLHKL